MHPGTSKPCIYTVCSNTGLLASLNASEFVVFKEWENYYTWLQPQDSFFRAAPPDWPLYSANKLRRTQSLYNNVSEHEEFCAGSMSVGLKCCPIMHLVMKAFLY